MSNVLPFPTVTPDMRVGYVSMPKTMAKNQMTRREYLEFAKRTLESFDYEQVLMSILDVEYYDASCDKIKGAVDDYFDLPERRE